MLRFLAQLFRVFGPRYRLAPTVSEYLDRSTRVGKTDQIPTELIPLAARLWSRGWFNRQFLDISRDWVLPYWATRQLDPTDKGFTSRALQPVFLNTAYRNWTALGNPDSRPKAIVDPRGLVTPNPDRWGWSLDAWVRVDGETFFPSRLQEGEITQKLYENLPLVQTQYEPARLRVNQEAFAIQNKGQDWLAAAYTIENPRGDARTATLVLALRPLNPEGAAVVDKIEFRSVGSGAELWVNDELGAVLPVPAAYAMSDMERGDAAFFLDSMNMEQSVSDRTGLATWVGAVPLELRPHTHKTILAVLPMSRTRESPGAAQTWSEPDALPKLKREFSTRWRTLLAQGMSIRVPDDAVQAAFDANKAHLLVLNEGDAITPGPFLYHQLWFRDAAFMLHALDQLGYHAQVNAVLETFPNYLRKDGFLQSQDGEWDSNGQVLWLLEQHARLSGDYELMHDEYWQMLNAAHWIDAARQKTKSKGERTPEYGLLPAGMSAEHLGPNDYYFWDDWWGLAGLRAAIFAATTFNSQDDAKKLQSAYDAFYRDVMDALARAAQKNHAEWMPASPTRRADSAMVSNLIASYPLQLLAPDDPRIEATIQKLTEIAFVDGAFFHHVGHGGFGTYLALHLAGAQLFQRKEEAWNALRFLMANASPTWTWGETIHPTTRRGGHGDGHHGWAAAEVVSFIRNALLFEEGNHLVVTPALPEDWVFETASIKVERAATYFGEVGFTMAFGNQNVTLVLKGKWRTPPEYIEWNLPIAIKDAGGDFAGVEVVNPHRVRFPSNMTKVVATF
jgi:hypothetical protein